MNGKQLRLWFALFALLLEGSGAQGQDEVTTQLPAVETELPPHEEPAVVEIVEPATEPVSTAEAGTVSESAAEPAVEPEAVAAKTPEAEPSSEPINEDAREPAAEAEPTTEVKPAEELEPAAEAEPEAQPEPALEAEPAAEPEPLSEPTIQSGTEPAAEPETEPAAEQLPEPAAKPETKPLAEPLPEPAAESEAKSATAPEAETDYQNDAAASQSHSSAEQTTMQPSPSLNTMNCYSCSSYPRGKCDQKPSDTSPCQAISKEGCYTLIKSDTQLIMRGCISELSEEGNKYCRKEPKHCVLCYDKLCNKDVAPPATASAVRILNNSAVWILYVIKLILF
ncbi:protein TsetseEP [Drosophila sulfurigaster albostrigata]|uniref:protein TsetseEP n=1 Tax=Drosophila sulfurigaster albostrigata TaxID=89887 RepID=UPI002D21DA2E|nr:protein TsetseEP [Drosophila sulfurigaster albostrigata]